MGAVHHFFHATTRYIFEHFFLMDPITSDDQNGEVNLTLLNAHTPDPVFRNQ